MSPTQRRIMDYLYRDLKEHGGTARRLSKINLYMAPEDSDKDFSRAIEGLRFHGLIALDEIADFGFIYARPLHAEDCHCNLCLGTPQGMPSEEVTPYAYAEPLDAPDAS